MNNKEKYVQWFCSDQDRYIKFETKTGKQAAVKTTKGPYKNIRIVKTKPKTTNQQSAPPTATPKKASRNYLNNRDLLAEVIRSKEQSRMTDKLAHMLTLLCARYGKRGNFASYTYNQDMQAYAMMMLVRTWNSFDPEKSNNPFAFFTQCIKNSFIQYLNQEKRHRTIRDEIMVSEGLNPSYSYQLEHESEQNSATLYEERDQFVNKNTLDEDSNDET